MDTEARRQARIIAAEISSTIRECSLSLENPDTHALATALVTVEAAFVNSIKDKVERKAMINWMRRGRRKALKTVAGAASIKQYTTPTETLN